MAALKTGVSDRVLTGPATERAELRSVKNAPSYHRVRDAIREDVIDGYFGDESRLVVSALCARYGVTAPPVREAFNQLEVEGLITISANRGARVRKIDAQFVSEIFEIRIALEPDMVWRSVPLMGEVDIVDLERLEREFEAAIAAGDGKAVALINGDFHLRIYNVRPNHEAIRLLRQHAALIRTLRNRFGYRANRVAEIIAEHRALIEACAAGDADGARGIARLHIEHSLADILSLTRLSDRGRHIEPA
jgi:DNA-binding GntR family transcriptional regulator